MTAQFLQLSANRLHCCACTIKATYSNMNYFVHTDI